VDHNPQLDFSPLAALLPIKGGAIRDHTRDCLHPVSPPTEARHAVNKDNELDHKGLQWTERGVTDWHWQTVADLDHDAVLLPRPHRQFTHEHAITLDLS